MGMLNHSTRKPMAHFKGNAITVRYPKGHTGGLHSMANNSIDWTFGEAVGIEDCTDYTGNGSNSTVDRWADHIKAEAQIAKLAGIEPGPRFAGMHFQYGRGSQKLAYPPNSWVVVRNGADGPIVAQLEVSGSADSKYLPLYGLRFKPSIDADTSQFIQSGATADDHYTNDVKGARITFILE
jgi:hypothetical protein